MHIFQKYLTNPVFIFRAFGRKTKIVGNFWENFDNFWWKFYSKIEFLFLILFFENLLLKIEPSEITPFSTTIFLVSGVRNFPPFPLATPLALINKLSSPFKPCFPVSSRKWKIRRENNRGITWIMFLFKFHQKFANFSLNSCDIFITVQNVGSFIVEFRKFQVPCKL